MVSAGWKIVTDMRPHAMHVRRSHHPSCLSKPFVFDSSMGYYLPCLTIDFILRRSAVRVVCARQQKEFVTFEEV